MAGRRVLAPVVEVRILPPQPFFVLEWPLRLVA